MKKLPVLLFCFFCLLPLSASEIPKIDHEQDQWYQLVCIEYRSARSPYVMRLLWRNPNWRNVTGMVEPEALDHGVFKTSDFQLVNPESQFGKDTQKAIAIFENHLLGEGHVLEVGDQVFKMNQGAVVWQPDTLFLLALYKLDYQIESENDAGYAWW